MTPPCKILEWDTEFWGFRVAAVAAGERLDDALATAVDEWCAAHRVRCLYFLGDGTCPTTLATAAHHGFRFVDIRLDLECEPQSLPARERDIDHEDRSVRVACADDLERVRQLAGQCHKDTRFFKDAGFAGPKAEELYRRWIEADYGRRSLLVAFLQSDPREPVGYVSYSLPAADRGRIGLIGIAEEHRGRGIAGTLLDAAMTALGDAGCNRVDVATQATNIAALRLYCRRGFLPSAARVWFHRWY